MILDTIKKNYEDYIRIYNKELQNLEETAKRLLENSLYLSVFTSFEEFIKGIINDYITKRCQENIRYTDLDEEIAIQFMLEKENRSRFNNIYSDNKRESIRAFNAYFEKIKNPLSQEELSKYIKFKFFHKDVLDKHYNVLFKQILGDGEFLRNIKITTTSKDEIHQEINIDGLTFIADFCDKVRNNIAHKNNSHTISEYSLQETIRGFEYIMEQIYNRYRNHTGFDLSTPARQNQVEI